MCLGATPHCRDRAGRPRPASPSSRCVGLLSLPLGATGAATRGLPQRSGASASGCLWTFAAAAEVGGHRRRPAAPSCASFASASASAAERARLRMRARPERGGGRARRETRRMAYILCIGGLLLSAFSIGGRRMDRAWPARRPERVSPECWSEMGAPSSSSDATRTVRLEIWRGSGPPGSRAGLAEPCREPGGPLPQQSPSRKRQVSSKSEL